MVILKWVLGGLAIVVGFSAVNLWIGYNIGINAQIIFSIFMVFIMMVYGALAGMAIFSEHIKY